MLALVLAFSMASFDLSAPQLFLSVKGDRMDINMNLWLILSEVGKWKVQGIVAKM